MSELKYPIYRKFMNGKEFMKLNSNGILIKVNMVRENNFSIIHTSNSFMVGEFNNPYVSMDSNRDEFEKAFGKAQFLLTKANQEQ